MNEMIKITVIIPMFNMGQYIEQCLNSILDQTLKEVEILCIDDGSSDDTEKIISRMQKEYSNIIYKKQMNLGSGSARNLGIACARGTYIAFMDADDFYPDVKALQYLYDAAERTKIEICGGSRCICHENVVAKDGARKDLIFSDDKAISAKQFSVYNGYQQFIYNRDFINKYHLRFPDYRRSQDSPFFAKVLSLADKIFLCGIYSYCYRKEHKEVIYDEIKAIDYIKGVRDTLEITVQSNMWKMYTSILNDFYGEASAVMYKYIADGNQEMLMLSREIRKLILPEKILKEDYIHGNRTLLEEDRIEEYVERTRKNWDFFFEQMSERKVLIFGAGTMARKLYGEFKKRNSLIEAFVVSDTKQNVEQIEGVRVRSIDDYCDVSDQYFVVFAAFGFWKDEMDRILRNKGFHRYQKIDLEELYLCGDRMMH